MDGAHLLAGLDADQRRAVTDPGAPLCILAGAGSGKTRVLTRRIACRCGDGAADPRHVLALTFTRKAAGGAGDPAPGPRPARPAGGRHVPRPGLGPAAHLVARPGPGRPDAARPQGADPGVAAGPQRRSRPAELAAEIEWAQARLVAARRLRRRRRTATTGARPAAPSTSPSASPRYEEEKRRRGLVDFDDLLAGCADALDGDPAFAAAQRWRFRHLFVDEFQDVNPLQHRLLARLAGRPARPLRRRRPQPGHLPLERRRRRRTCGSFADRYPGGRRSSPSPTTTGRRRRSSTWPPPSSAPARRRGSAPTGRRARSRRSPSYPTDRDEARGVGRADPRRRTGPARRWDRQAVLVRTNAQMPAVEEALTRARIPFRLRGGEPLLAPPEVRDALRRIGRSPVAPAGRRARRPRRAGRRGAAETPGQERHRRRPRRRSLRLGRDLAALEPRGRPWATCAGGSPAAIGADGPGAAGDAVDVVTFHAAKGLEWPVVHLARPRGRPRAHRPRPHPRGRGRGAAPALRRRHPGRGRAAPLVGRAADVRRPRRRPPSRRRTSPSLSSAIGARPARDARPAPTRPTGWPRPAGAGGRGRTATTTAPCCTRCGRGGREAARARRRPAVGGGQRPGAVGRAPTAVPLDRGRPRPRSAASGPHARRPRRRPRSAMVADHAAPASRALVP